MSAEIRFIQRNFLFLLLLSSGYLSSLSGMGSVAAQSAWRPGDRVRRLTGSYADPAPNTSRFSLTNRARRPNSYASPRASARRGSAYYTAGSSTAVGKNNANYSPNRYRGAPTSPPSQSYPENYPKVHQGAGAGNGDQSYATVPYRRGARQPFRNGTRAAGGMRDGMRPGARARGVRAYNGAQRVANSRPSPPRRTQRGVVSPYYDSDRWCPDPCCIQWCFFRREYFIKPTYCQPYRCCQPKPECCPAERPPCPPPPCVDECGRPQEGGDEAAASQQALEAIADEYLGRDGLGVVSEYI